jgi:hypothetical protein
MLIAWGALLFGCAPIQELYLSPSGANSLQKQSMDKKRIISIDTLNAGGDKIIQVRFRDKK